VIVPGRKGDHPLRGKKKKRSKKNLWRRVLSGDEEKEEDRATRKGSGRPACGKGKKKNKKRPGGRGRST